MSLRLRQTACHLAALADGVVGAAVFGVDLGHGADVQPGLRALDIGDHFGVVFFHDGL